MNYVLKKILIQNNFTVKNIISVVVILCALYEITSGNNLPKLFSANDKNEFLSINVMYKDFKFLLHCLYDNTTLFDR